MQADSQLALHTGLTGMIVWRLVRIDVGDNTWYSSLPNAPEYAGIRCDFSQIQLSLPSAGSNHQITLLFVPQRQISPVCPQEIKRCLKYRSKDLLRIGSS